MVPDLHYRITSVTKTFTADAVLRLVGQGTVALTDPISSYASVGTAHQLGRAAPVRPRDHAAANGIAVPSQPLRGEIVKVLYPDSLPNWS